MTPFLITIVSDWSSVIHYLQFADNYQISLAGDNQVSNKKPNTADRKIIILPAVSAAAADSYSTFEYSEN